MDSRRLGISAALTLAMLAALSRSAWGEDAIRPGAVETDPPTLICLGVHWPYAGDDDLDASVRVRYRRAGGSEADWKEALPLFRIRPENVTKDGFAPKKISRAFAGSIFDLEPDTPYEIELALTDPDGGSVTRTVHSRTRPVPEVPRDARVVDVPAGGLAAALGSARPGDVLLLGKGVHTGAFRIGNQATAARPIVIRGVSRDEVIIDGGGKTTAMEASGAAYVYFERLTFRNCREAIRAHRATGIVVRRCRTVGIHSPIRCTLPPARDFFIADNVLEGPCTWPAPGGRIEGEEGIQLIGSGHVVCHNKIVGFGDAISIFRNPAVSIDFYGNEIDVGTDDGIEMDYSDRNTRCFRNRITNARCGISVQPAYGGPCYVFRNEVFNTSYGAFKLHNQPSGVLVYHNTSVRRGVALVVWSGVPVCDHVFRNNLFVGTGEQMADWTSKTVNCDLDYNGYGPGKGRFKIGNVNYSSVAAAAWAGIEPRGRMLDAPFFADAVAVPAKSSERVRSANFDLHPRSGAVDAGVKLPNVNEGFKGSASDLGARELGSSPPFYGPRPEGVQLSGRPEAPSEREKSVWALVAERLKAGPSRPAAAAEMPGLVKARVLASGGDYEAAARELAKELPSAAEKADELEAFVAGFRAAKEMRAWIVRRATEGRRESIFVELLGVKVRGKVIAADGDGLTVVALGDESRLRWGELSPARFLSLARKYAREGRDTPAERLGVLELFARACGLRSSF